MIHGSMKGLHEVRSSAPDATGTGFSIPQHNAQGLGDPSLVLISAARQAPRLRLSEAD